MKKTFLFTALLCLVSLMGCKEEVEFKMPKISLSPGECGETTLSFNIVSENCDAAAFMCIEATAQMPAAEEILASGQSVENGEHAETVESLKPGTRYYIVAAAKANDVQVSARTISMTTGQTPDQPQTAAVSISVQEKDAVSFSFKITPTEAVKCAYVILNPGEELIPNDEDVIETGASVLPDAPSIHKVTGLEPNLEYIVVAAVQNGDRFESETLVVRTAKAGEMEFNVESASGHKILDNNYFVKFKNAENTIALDFFAEESQWLPAGTYILSREKGENVIWSTSSKFSKDDQFLTFTEGKAEVKLNKDIYDIAFELKLSDATLVRGSYHGKIEGMNVYVEKETVELNIERIKWEQIENAAPGQFYLKMSDNAETYEMALDLYDFEFNELLQAGKYNFGEGERTFSGESYIQTASEKVNFTEGTVMVEMDSYIYTLDIDIVGNDNKRYIAAYNGEIENMMPVLPDPKVGDYYYSDGTWSDGGLISMDPDGLNAVWEEDKPQPLSGKTVIGIVCQTNPDRIAQSDKDNGFVRGYVIATRIAHQEGKNTTYWSTDADFGCLENKKLATSWYNNVNGYAETMKVKETYGEGLAQWMPAFDLVLNHFPAAAPKKTSGWFLPSTGQLWDVAANLCGSAVAEYMQEWQTFRYDATYYCSERVDYSVMDFFNNHMKYVDDADKDLMIQDSAREKFCSVWTSTPYEAESVCIIEFGSEGLIECMTNWYDADCQARPILAF